MKMDDRSEVSKVEALTKVDKTQIEFCWRIENFLFCSKKQDILESPTFGSDRPSDCLRFRVRLYTKGINEKYSRYIGLFLVMVQDKSLNKKLPKEVFYNFCILNAEHQKVNLVRSNDSREFSREMDSWGFPKFLARSLIETDYNNLVPNDQLTILVEMTIYGHISTSEKFVQEIEPSPPINIQAKDRTPSVEKSQRSINKIPAFKRTEIELTKRKDFADFLLNDKYSDMILISSEGTELPVHRILLANESPIFSHKFDSLTQKNRLELKNFDSKILNDVLRFIYTRNMDFKSSLDKLLNFVDAYQMNALKAHFEQEIIGKINISNAAKYLQISYKCNAINLKDKVLDFIKINFYKVNKTDEWKKLAETEPQMASEVYRQLLIDK